MHMHTNPEDLRPLHRAAVLHTIDVVETVTQKDFGRATPCRGWTVLDLLAHMTVQHRGFAAAARGVGADVRKWDADAVIEQVRSDHVRTYTDAVGDVIDAFASPGTLAAPFALPEFGAGVVVPGAMAIGFHFVDYVVHGWDVAASLGLGYDLPADVLAAALPLALAVPDGEFREGDATPFAAAIEAAGGNDFDRILRHLGRRPDWARTHVHSEGASQTLPGQ
jgi:uncharacterized protein (TIGR03086 family)